MVFDNIAPFVQFIADDENENIIKFDVIDLKSVYKLLQNQLNYQHDSLSSEYYFHVTENNYRYYDCYIVSMNFNFEDSGDNNLCIRYRYKS